MGGGWVGPGRGAGGATSRMLGSRPAEVTTRKASTGAAGRAGDSESIDTTAAAALEAARRAAISVRAVPHAPALHALRVRRGRPSALCRTCAACHGDREAEASSSRGRRGLGGPFPPRRETRLCSLWGRLRVSLAANTAATNCCVCVTRVYSLLGPYINSRLAANTAAIVAARRRRNQGRASGSGPAATRGGPAGGAGGTSWRLMHSDRPARSAEETTKSRAWNGAAGRDAITCAPREKRAGAQSRHKDSDRLGQGPQRLG